MADENPDFMTTPCSTCNETLAEDELMVDCAHCQRSFHARCVNFIPTDKKSGKKWYCPDKDCQKKKKTKKSVEEPLPVPPELQEKLKALEETRKRAEAEQEMARIVKEKELEMFAGLQERQMLIDEELREKEAKRAEKLRERDFKRREADLAAEMVKKEEHLKRIQQLETTFRDKSASIDKLLKNSSTPLRNPEVKPLTEGNVAEHDVRGTPGNNSVNPGGNPGDPGSTKSSKKPDSSTKSSTDSSSDNSSESGVAADGNGDEKSAKTTQSTKFDLSKPDGLGQHGSGPTKAQRAARQGLTRKLPDFHGKPEEWPLFFAAYQASNDACGYTDVENLVRLQDCLKDRALEDVRGQLILPKSVPRVIAKLRQLYGRPEVLLQSHLLRVRKLEPPKADKLATFIPFGNAVEQLCEHIEAAELTAHLMNPILIQELVDKLPEGEKRSWVQYKRKKREVNLRTLTNFLSKIVEDACEATVHLDRKSDARPASGPGEKSWHTEKNELFCHSEAESYMECKERQQRQLKQCKVCQRTDHRLRFCDDFKKMPYEERMEVVTNWRLCHQCLNGHGGICRFKFRCNIGECRELHNPLLHPESIAVGVSAHITSTSPVLFRMLPVKVYCGERSQVVLAFLDEGSSLTLIESGLADSLGLMGTKEKLTIKWTADITRVEENSRRTNLWASEINGSRSEKLLLRSVRTVDKLMLPHQRLKAEEVTAHYEHLRELPVDSYDGRPKILIGLNNIHSFAPLEAKVGTAVDPVAVRSKLGWSVYGPRDAESASAISFIGCHQGAAKEKLRDRQYCRFALEKTLVNVESVEDQRSRQVVHRGRRDRFDTDLPEKIGKSEKSNGKSALVKRNKLLERSFKQPSAPRSTWCRNATKQFKGKRLIGTSGDCSLQQNDTSWKNGTETLIEVGDEASLEEQNEKTSGKARRRAVHHGTGTPKAAHFIAKNRPIWKKRSIPAGELAFVVEGQNRKSWVRRKVENEGSNGGIRLADVRTGDGMVNRRIVVNLAMLKVQGKSDVPEGTTDVTGWGVATAKMGTLPCGVTATVQSSDTVLAVNTREKEKQGKTQCVCDTQFQDTRCKSPFAKSKAI